MNSEQLKIFDDTQEVEQEIGLVIEREYDRTKQVDITDSYIKKIENRHEAYGYASEYVSKLRMLTKSIDADLKEFLDKLSQNDDIIVRDVGSYLYGHASKLAAEAVKAAAVAKRIIYDVLVLDEQLPIEAAFNNSNDTSAEADNIDYDEAESK